MTGKCEHCPVRGLDRPCLAETTGHRRYCELVDPGHPAYRPAYIPLLAETAPAPEPEDPAEAARRRRASKPRIALGVKQRHG
jgi:hypothetical protein